MQFIINYERTFRMTLLNLYVMHNRVSSNKILHFLLI
jgi:hypothetical protein